MPALNLSPSWRRVLSALSLFGLCSACAALAFSNGPSERVGLCSALYAVAFALLLVHVAVDRGDSTAWAYARLLAPGLLLRLAFVLAASPGGDLFRSIWEGHVQTMGVNPYLVPPNAPTLDAMGHGALAAIRAKINHPNLTAIYPPLAELCFRALAALSPTALCFKAFFAACDFGAVCFIAALCRRRGLGASRLALYALNPLVLLFLAGEGHLDALQLLFMAMGLWAMDSRRESLGFFALGLAGMGKYLAFLLIPFFMDAKNAPKALWSLVPLLVFLPYLDAGQGLFSSLTTFAANARYNDSLTALLAAFGVGPAWVGLFLLPVLAAIWLLVQDRLRAAMYALAALLLCLPSLHPWYLVLLAPFLPLYPSPAWLTLQASQFLVFPVMAVERASGVFTEIPWLKALEYVPFYGMLLARLGRDRRIFPGPGHPGPTTISLVIPTLNEGADIEACLASARGFTDIVVADGGSRDRTRAIATRLGARVIETGRGRGAQIRAGIAAARGEVVAILHADCRLPEDAGAAILAALTADPGASGGSLSMRFTGSGSGARVVALLNNVRARFFGLSFGDQVQFFRREALLRGGGFPETMLMEDVECALRLKEAGRVLFLRQTALVSHRTWGRRGFARNFRLVVGLFVRYLAERRWGVVDQSGKRYYERYYR